MNVTKNDALLFVILLGIVSLFADITYEGARSLSGQYLALLGASGAVVGGVAGFGEFIGYSLRLISGYYSDRTGRYWLLTIVGYVINLLAVPMLALAGNWPAASALMILERFGKSIRSPARDAMLSYATKEIGRGFGFGLHEAMDQIGAILGPLLVGCVLILNGSYPTAFATLGVPACCALVALFIAKRLFPEPRSLEPSYVPINTGGLSFPYWTYIAAVCFVAAGYVDFALIAYHMQKTQSHPVAWIPFFYCLAMAADGFAALILGKLFDKWGLSILVYSILASSFFVIFVFADSIYLNLLGIMLWGIGLGVQESVMRAVLANLVSVDKRATAYGTFHFWFGTFWFLGSTLLGILYDISIVSVITFSLACQGVAFIILMYLFYHKRYL